jgi:two-component system, OmpR family, KDP operon response regulator KdpE
MASRSTAKSDASRTPIRGASFAMSGTLTVQPLILVVEHDQHPGRSIVSTLAVQGFRTLQAPPRAAALTRAVGHEPDLILLDVSDAGVDGVGLTTRMRDWGSAPIIAILSRSRESERAALLDAGANDYIIRPFATADLLARMRVWLREKARMQAQRFSSDAPVERLRIDRDRRTLYVDGREVHITPLECKLLLILAHSGGRSLTEEQILTAVWGSNAPARPQYLRAHVRQLRQKLERDPARPRYLVTEAGGGYRLKLG